MLEFYIRNGGMGIIIPSLKNEGNIKNIIKVIYHDCLLKDIKQRYKIKNITELEELNKYLFDTIGNPISIEKMEQ
jgi:predicted AAA+ superfamily ATPase